MDRPDLELELTPNQPTDKAPEGRNDDGIPPQYSDEQLTLRFEERYRDDLRHCNRLGGWHYWDGARWRLDHIDLTLGNARQLCRAISQEVMGCGLDEATRKKIANRVASERTVHAILKLAKGGKGIRRDADQFDCDPWLLNTPRGTIDLRPGEMRRHHREDHITMVTRASPSGDCPNFKAFLEQATQGDRELQAFLQRAAGLMLTGDTSAHAIFFIYGPGGNGKTVLGLILQDVLGDYASAAPMSMLVQRKNQEHPTEVAGLKGKRLLVASETDSDHYFDTAKLKLLTGGDEVQARFMRQDFFTFQPEFKILVMGNHLPRIRVVDDGVKRRLHIIPLTYKPEKPNPGLRDELLAERDSILVWMLDGLRQYQKSGLDPIPECIANATNEYFNMVDTIRRWVRMFCELDPAAKTAKADLYKSYTSACADDGAMPLSRATLLTELKKLECTDFRLTGGTRALAGIALRPTPPPDTQNGATPVSDDPGGSTG